MFYMMCSVIIMDQPKKDLSLSSFQTNSRQQDHSRGEIHPDVNIPAMCSKRVYKGFKESLWDTILFHLPFLTILFFLFLSQFPHALSSFLSLESFSSSPYFLLLLIAGRITLERQDQYWSSCPEDMNPSAGSTENSAGLPCPTQTG